MKAELLSKPTFADTKPHYKLLDGLRGALHFSSYGIMCTKDSLLLAEA